MKPLRRALFLRTLGSCVAVSLAVAVGCAVEHTVFSQPSLCMSGLSQAWETAFLLSLQQPTEPQPVQQQRLLSAFQALIVQAEHLQAHASEAPLSRDFWRQTMVRDARTVLQRYTLGKYEAASFALRRLTNSCFACHTHGPSPRPATRGQVFLAAPPIVSLPLHERARLAVVTRQFTTALQLYEALLRSPTLSARDIDWQGGLEDFLTLVLRVQEDVPRALTALAMFAQRQDVPPALQEHLDTWRAALQSLQATQPFRASSGDALATARALIHAAQSWQRFPADRAGLVHFIAASGVLYRLLRTEITERSHLAEAYYLLGMATAFIGRSLWLNETEFYLETAIRLAPQSSFARRAYAFLEAYITTNFTGSGGTHIPPEIQQHLAELRTLLDLF